jgi:hypothetical protein
MWDWTIRNRVSRHLHRDDAQVEESGMRFLKMDLLKTLIASCCIVLPSPGIAGSASGTISWYTAFNNGIVLFLVSDSRSDMPSCASNNANRWAIDGSTVAGQVLASQIITGYSLGKSVIVQGTGDCRVGFDSEAVSYAILQ